MSVNANVKVTSLHQLGTSWTCSQSSWQQNRPALPFRWSSGIPAHFPKVWDKPSPRGTLPSSVPVRVCWGCVQCPSSGFGKPKYKYAHSYYIFSFNFHESLIQSASYFIMSFMNFFFCIVVQEKKVLWVPVSSSCPSSEQAPSSPGSLGRWVACCQRRSTLSSERCQGRSHSFQTGHQRLAQILCPPCQSVMVTKFSFTT